MKIENVMDSSNLFILIEWEVNNENAQSFGIIDKSHLRQPMSEIYSGKLITVNYNGEVRRAKVVHMSGMD